MQRDGGNEAERNAAAGPQTEACRWRTRAFSNCTPTTSKLVPKVRCKFGRRVFPVLTITASGPKTSWQNRG